MKTDYEVSGKTYQEIEAYVKGTCRGSMPDPAQWYYFGCTKQFKTCKSFKAYLSAKHPGHTFKAVRAH